MTDHKSGSNPEQMHPSASEQQDTPHNGPPPLSRTSFSIGDSKPDLLRAPSVQTRYMNMLLSLDNIPRSHNILVACSTWIFLAGFVIFPGTFTSLQKSDTLQDNKSENVVEHAILHTVKNAPLMWVAGSCCIIGGLGMAALWIKWRANYVWLISRIFL
jgi:hypothetical protein